MGKNSSFFVASRSWFVRCGEEGRERVLGLGSPLRRAFTIGNGTGDDIMLMWRDGKRNRSVTGGTGGRGLAEEAGSGARPGARGRSREGDGEVRGSSNSLVLSPRNQNLHLQMANTNFRYSATRVVCGEPARGPGFAKFPEGR